MPRIFPRSEGSYISARDAAPVATKGPVLSPKKGDDYHYVNRVCRRNRCWRLPNCLDGTHAEENVEGLSLCSSNKSYQ